MIINPITLDSLNYSLQNNEHYFKVLRGEKTRLMIEKWPHLSTFTITILDLDRDHIYNIYDHLYIYDTYNMINELCVEL